MFRLPRISSPSFALGVACALSLLGGLRPAQADPLTYEGWGVRAGLSGDPDQFVIGMHMRLGELAENLRLEPNVDIGFGDDLTVFTLNPDLTYSVPVEGAGSFYFGGTLSLVFARFDAGDDSNSDTDLGIAAIIGYLLPVTNEAIGIDLKLGLSDEYPDLKVMATYTFPR